MKKNLFLRIVKGVLLAGAILAVSLFLFACVTLLDADAWDAFDPEKILGAAETSILYDATDHEIARLHGSEDRISIRLSTLPDYVPQAFIAAEDARFYSHRGIDVIRILGAAWEDIKAGGYVQGASTISQQLIKLSHLSSEKTMSRKLEEAVLAYRMEQTYTKTEILEMYVNYVYFGGGYYGVEAASRGYFGIPAEKLSVAQAAMLAGILKAPSRYAPHLAMEASTTRRNHILGLMREQGYITAEACVEAQKENVEIVHNNKEDFTRGYYVNTAISQAAEILQINREELLTGGYRIYTAYDAKLQQICETLLEDDALFAAPDVQGALVVQRANTGYVSALVGGRNSASGEAFNRATDIRRQPGSVIKPILCYAPALEYYDYTAATMLLDERETFGDYAPENFGSQYYGWVTMRKAVTKSLNIPAVKVLSSVGVSNAKNFAQSVGIAFDDTDNSLALALGGFKYGISPWMAAGAYNAFASGGVFHAPTTIRAILDAEDRLLYQYDEAGVRVMREENAYILNSMLQSVVREGTGHRLGALGIPLSGKTGTVGEGEGNRDAWMAAYNPEYTAVVWMGYDDSYQGVLPEDATGGKYPALLLHALFDMLYPDKNAPDFAVPQGIVEVKLDAHSLEHTHAAVLASALTPKSSEVNEVFVRGSEPTVQSEYWSVPLPIRDLSVANGTDGYPKISFSARENHVLYKLYREDEQDQTVCLQSWTGTKNIAYTDTKIQAGTGYTYYVVPEHPGMAINGRNVTGAASTPVHTFVPALSFTPEKEPSAGKNNANVLDLTNIFS